MQVYYMLSCEFVRMNWSCVISSVKPCDTVCQASVLGVV